MTDKITQDTPDSSVKIVPGKYKVILLGDGGVGKSSFVARLNDGKFHHEYVATLGVEKFDIEIDTSHGQCTFQIWDTAGQEKIGPLRFCYYEGADAAIIFFDVTSRVTYKNVPSWYRDITSWYPDIPIVLCANKIDADDRKVKSKSISFHNNHKVGLYEISVKKQVNLEKPFEYILRQILKEPELTLIGSLDAGLHKAMGGIDL